MNPEITRIFQLQLANKRKIRQTSAEERIQKINLLMEAINDRLPELKKAVFEDLGKPPAEVMLSEVYPIITEIKTIRRKLKKWMLPKHVPAPIALLGSKNEIHLEPKGVVLIMAPWNFPFQLAISPLMSALAAGNCVMLKPSEISANTSRFIKSLIDDFFEQNEVAVFEGDAEIGKALLDLPFNHILFTGSTTVGKKVMAAAAKHLSSVTLELGGKSPVLIDKTADIKEAAKRITWGKFLNAGQTCIAPDYVLVPKKQLDEFVDKSKKHIQKLYGKNSIHTNPDYCRIIDEKSFARLKSLVDEALKSDAAIQIGGEFADVNFIAPTLMTNVNVDSGIMKEEIFGPVLPILPYDSIEDALDMINAKPNPLALYIFSKDKEINRQILQNTSAGDTVINDVVVHFSNINLPFGGSNHSGIGKSHGFAGFKAFSHERSVMHQPRFSMVKLLYPPYSAITKKIIDLTIKYF